MTTWAGLSRKKLTFFCGLVLNTDFLELIKSISLTLHDIDISYICSHPFVFRVDPYFSALVFSRLNRQQDEVEPQVAGLGNLLEVEIRFLHFLFISTLLGHKILFCAAHFFFLQYSTYQHFQSCAQYL